MTRQEFETLIKQEGKAVYSFCRMLAAGREAADELYQDTMLAALEHCGEIENSGHPKAYLNSIAVGIYRNGRKKFARRQRIAPVEALTDELSAVVADERVNLEGQVLLKELRQAVQAETRALPEKLRLPLYLYYTAQLSVEEVAGILHIPSGTVKSRLHKARCIMKERLEGYGYGDRTGD